MSRTPDLLLKVCRKDTGEDAKQGAAWINYPPDPERPFQCVCCGVSVQLSGGGDWPEEPHLQLCSACAVKQVDILWRRFQRLCRCSEEGCLRPPVFRYPCNGRLLCHEHYYSKGEVRIGWEELQP